MDKAYFAHDAAYSDSKDIAKRTVSDKVFKDRAYQIPRNPKYAGYQRGLASMVYKIFDKETGLGASVNKDLAEELHKPVIKKLKRRKVYARFKVFLVGNQRWCILLSLGHCILLSSIT